MMNIVNAITSNNLMPVSVESVKMGCKDFKYIGRVLLRINLEKIELQDKVEILEQECEELRVKHKIFQDINEKNIKNIEEYIQDIQKIVDILAKDMTDKQYKDICDNLKNIFDCSKLFFEGEEEEDELSTIPPQDD